MSAAAPAIPRTPKPGERATAKGSGSTMPDPVGELRFMVSIDGVRIGAFTECSGLTVEYEILEYQEGGEDRYTHKLRGRLKYPNLVLKRGVTHENHLLKWLFDQQETKERGTVAVTLIGDNGAAVRTWEFAGAFPVKWQGPSLNAKSTNIATETLEIAHQGLFLPV